MTRILTSVIVLLVLAASGARSQCLKPNVQTVTLKGLVFARDFPGPPNYESIRSGDERIRYWILRLNKPICVDGDDIGAAVSNIRELQIVFKEDTFYKRYSTLVRKRARFQVVGTLFHWNTGHHVRQILIEVQRFAPLRK